ncbi:LysR family transcriptional regulator [Vibrio vulnificus]|uniref:LysR family transcriptional regulator n=1 Tax=Vibrio vulnificus TaxID=672 RepID=UPI003EDA80BF
MYSLTSLVYAEAAARLNSFSAAARECGVSQPTVSSSVAELEAALGAPLFVRGGRQLQLSSQGSKLLPHIRDILDAVSALEKETSELCATARSELRIGFTPLVGAGRIALLLQPFRSKYTNIHQFFFESGVDDLEQRFEAGQLDIVIGTGFRKARNRKHLNLFQDSLMLCVQGITEHTIPSITLALASQQCVLLTQDLCGLATVTRDLFDNAKLDIDIYPGRAMSYSALEDWAALGLGNAVLPAYHIRNKTHAYPLVNDQGSELYLDIDVVWKTSLAAAEHAAKFLTFLHREAPRLALDVNN